MPLTKDQILTMQDLEIKEIEVPQWKDTVYIKQLTRGQQDRYMKRQFGTMAMKQQGRKQEIDSSIDVFGHDAWLFAQGVVDADGKRMFTDNEVKGLEEKNGEAIGHVAKGILDFSGMSEDVSQLEDLKN